MVARKLVSRESWCQIRESWCHGENWCPIVLSSEDDLTLIFPLSSRTSSWRPRSVPARRLSSASRLTCRRLSAFTIDRPAQAPATVVAQIVGQTVPAGQGSGIQHRGREKKRRQTIFDPDPDDQWAARMTSNPGARVRIGIFRCLLGVLRVLCVGSASEIPDRALTLKPGRSCSGSSAARREIPRSIETRNKVHACMVRRWNKTKKKTVLRIRLGRDQGTRCCLVALSKRWKLALISIGLISPPRWEQDSEINGLIDVLATRIPSAALQTIESAAGSEIGPKGQSTRKMIKETAVDGPVFPQILASRARNC
jgi:hypothetical protein